MPEVHLRGIVSWRAKASPDIKQVEFIVDGRVVHVDRRRPFAYPLNTAKLANRGYKLQVHGIAGPGRYDVDGARVLVDNKTFALTSAGAPVDARAEHDSLLRAPWGQKAAKMNFTVDGRTRAVDRRALPLRVGHARAKPGRHVLRVVATSVDGRTAVRRIPVVVHRPRPKQAPKPKPVPKPVPLAIVGQSVQEGQGSAGSSSGASTCADVRSTWSSSSTATFAARTSRRPTPSAGTRTPSRQACTATARAVGAKTVEASVTVTSAGSAAPDELRVELARGRERDERVDDPAPVALVVSTRSAPAQLEDEPRRARSGFRARPASP